MPILIDSFHIWRIIIWKEEYHSITIMISDPKLGITRDYLENLFAVVQLTFYYHVVVNPPQIVSRNDFPNPLVQSFSHRLRRLRANSRNYDGGLSYRSTLLFSHLQEESRPNLK